MSLYIHWMGVAAGLKAFLEKCRCKTKSMYPCNWAFWNNLALGSVFVIKCKRIFCKQYSAVFSCSICSLHLSSRLEPAFDCIIY